MSINLRTNGGIDAMARLNRGTTLVGMINRCPSKSVANATNAANVPTTTNRYPPKNMSEDSERSNKKDNDAHRIANTTGP